MKVLLVCTANRCRSPMAAALLRAALPASERDAVAITSAGRLESGVEASGGAVRALARRDLDLSAHRSTRLRAAALADADLVVGMAREHVREAVVLLPASFARAFTLKELVRLGEQRGARRAGEPLTAWLDMVGAGREPRALLGDSPADDVADPIGGPDPAYEQTADELAGLTRRLSALLFPG